VPKRSARTHDAGGRRIPFSNDVHFELPLSESSDLHDHRLGDSIVVPAGAYLSFAIEHLGATTLRDVSFLQPLTIASDTTLHLVASGDSFRFATEQGGEWVAHCRGKYDRGELRSDAVRPDVAGEPLTASADAGFTLGPSFQWIRNLKRNGDEIFCDLEHPSGAETTAFHPALIDSCLRTRSIGLDEVHVPFHIDELRVFAKPKAPLSCHSIPGVIRLFNGDTAAMEIRGFEVRKLERARELPLLRVEWQPAVTAPAGEHVDVFDFTNVLALRGTRNVRFITHGAQAVLAGDRIDPSHAWVWGLVKSAVIEQPQLNWSCVDLDPAASIDEQLPLLANTPRESLIAFRGGRAYVPRLAQTRMSALPVRLRDDAAYVITGASGALGRQVARWMVERGARHLILVSRTPPPLDGLERANVRVVSADISTAENLFDSPVPVRGVIHAAGVIDDALLDDLTWERFERVFAPKVGGTWNLHRQSLGLDLDFFVCFSSAASMIGSRGQANYAAANAFVDALMHHRRSIGLPGLSINWGAWGGAGMAASHAGQMESTGIHLIDPRDGLDTLGRLLQSDAAQVGVIPADWPKLLASLFGDAPPRFFEKFAQPAAEPRERILPLLEQTPPDARRERLESHIRGLVVSVMGHDAFAAAGDDRSFFELGMDSLMSLDLRNRLQRELDRNLPSTVAFEYPAVRELADYLISAVLPAGMFA
jgi:acyl carrier protein